MYRNEKIATVNFAAAHVEISEVKTREGCHFDIAKA
jgi:hypothetical protein